MLAQPKRVRNGFKDVQSSWKQLTETSIDTALSQRLTKSHINRIKKVKSNEKREGLPPAAVKQHKFLKKVLRIDSDYHTLCKIAFSQNQIDSTKAAILEQLVERIRERRNDTTIISPRMRSLIAHTEDPEPVRQLEEPKQRSTSASEQWAELKYAEREGTREVFGEYLADRIKTTELNDNWRAVTMRLPRWPADLPILCFVSLELREESVKELARALFKVEVDWVTDDFHIVHPGGMLQSIPNSEHTLKGVLDEDIVAVFGSDVHAAISSCCIRASEIAGGKARTKCVSMTFSKTKGTIDLTMSVPDGFNIQDKLYATAI